MRVHLLEFILGKSIMLRVTLREQLKVKLRVEVVEFKLVLFNTKRMTLHKSNVQTKTIR